MKNRNIALSLDKQKDENKYYTGIGSRHITDPTIKEIMVKLGYYLALDGWILRSGGADESDEYFEMGADLACLKTKLKNKIIFLPWKGFNTNPSKWFNVNTEAILHAKKYLIYFDKLKEPTQKLMARNSYQVLGYFLNKPSKFLICWTPDGCKSIIERTKETGGTGQAISIADDNKIPIFNLKLKEDFIKIKTKLKKYEEQYGIMPDYNILYDPNLKYQYNDIELFEKYKDSLNNINVYKNKIQKK